MTETILCLASSFKGAAFLQACKEAGLHVILATNDKSKDEAWPREHIDEFFHMPDLGRRPDILHAVAYLARTRHIDLIVALDDFDVETAAHLREHFRLPGMGDSLARNFRDKLAMRTTARNAGLLVPEFTGVFNHDDLKDFIALQAKFKGSVNSWTVDVKSIDKVTYDLSVKNPNKADETELREPKDIIAEMAALDMESAEILARIGKML